MDGETVRKGRETEEKKKKADRLAVITFCAAGP